MGKPAAFDITVTSPLTPITQHEASVARGSTAQVAEYRKHASMTQSTRSVGVCGFWQSRFMVVGGLKHRPTLLDLLRALQLDRILTSPRPLLLSMVG